MHRYLAAVCGLWSLNCLLPIALPGPIAGDQFSPPQAPPPGVFFDDVRAEIVNYETIMVEPITVLHDGRVLVANEADGRLTVLSAALDQILAEVPLGQGLCAVVPRPNSDEIWVSARHQSSIWVLDSNTWIVEALVRAPVSPTDVGGLDAMAPGGIAFSANGAKAFVPAFYTDTLLVFDATAKTLIDRVVLQFPHNGFDDTRMNEPLFVARYGNRIVVASHRSGNDSLAEALEHTEENLEKLEVLNVVRNLVVDDALSLPDFDLFVVDATTHAILDVKKNTGHLTSGLSIDPANGTIVVATNSSFNGTFLGEGSFPKGRVTFSHLTQIDIEGPPEGPHARVITENLPSGQHVVLPADLALDSKGRRFVAGYGSSNIGVFAANGSFVGLLEAESGPAGLALDSSSQWLYCYNRAEGSVTGYDLSSGLPQSWSRRRALTDPTYDRVKSGRQIFLDPSNSGAGSTSCASCHLNLRSDGLAWDLSAFDDPGNLFNLANPPQFWRDRKGAMQTQDLRSLEEIPGYHWRGEKRDLDGFNSAFEELLQGDRLTEEDFSLLEAYVFSGRYPANPHQSMNRGFSNVATYGARAFQDAAAVGTMSCVDCHAFPLGTDTSLTDMQNSARNIKTAQLRGLFTKRASEAQLRNDTTHPDGPLMVHSLGTGFLHHGQVRSIGGFLSQTFGHLGPDVAALTEFVHEFDSGVSPASNYSAFLDPNSDAAAGTFLYDQAVFGHCGLAVRGWYLEQGNWHPLGYFLDTSRTPPVFVPSDSTQPTETLASLRDRALQGDARWLLLGVPTGSEQRVGVDRDRDGVFDHDELPRGLDPADPDSDGDGLWDGHPSGLGAPRVLDLQVEWATSSSIKITYQTDLLSPTSLSWTVAGSTEPAGNSGDPFPLPTGSANTSNHWKRIHTAFARPLEENELYEIRIRTQSQRGAIAESIVPFASASTLADPLAPALMVGDIHLMTMPSMTGRMTYIATVEIVDNQGVPQSDVQVFGRFTVFEDGVPVRRVTAPATRVTDGMGKTTLSLEARSVAAGDGVSFAVPAHADHETDPAKPPRFEQAVFYATGPRGHFMWSDGNIDDVKSIR